MPKIPDRATLEKRRPVVIADLLAKVEAEDWHGVADAAMDLREIDAQLMVLPVPGEWRSVQKPCDQCGLPVVTEGKGNFVVAFRHEDCAYPNHVMSMP